MDETRILIVEDEGIIAEDIKRSLKEVGYNIFSTASSGREAFEKIKEALPDLVLMDIVLQGEMDGIEAADQINSQYNIPVVYLTAFANIDILDRAKKTEPFGYIIKPFEDREVQATVEMALHKHKIEKRLRESEEWLSITLKSIGDAVIATDSKGLVSFMNPIAQSLTGWKQEEAIGKPLKEVFNIINEKTQAPAENPVARVIREGIVVGLANHTVLISKDGKETPIDDSAAPIKDEIGNTIGVVLVFSDVSERRKAEKAILERERQLVASQKVARLGSWEWDIIQNKVTWSDELYHLFGTKPQEFEATYEAFLDMVHPDDRGDLDKAVKESMEKKKPYIIDSRIIRSDGTEWIMQVRGEVTYDKSGNPILMRGTAQDVTEPKRAEDALRESEEKYRTLVESSSDCICHIDLDGKIMYINPGGVKLNEYKSQVDVIGQKCTTAIIEEYKVLMNEALEKARQGETASLEYKSTNSKGKELWWESKVGPIKDQKGNVISLVRVSRDITEKKRLEEELKNYVEQLETSNKLKDVFTDILRHDLLNPIGIIQNAGEMLVERDILSHDVDELRLIQRNVTKLQTMIDNATKYAKLEVTEKLDFEKKDLNTIIEIAIKRVIHLAQEKDDTIVNKISGKHVTLVNPFIEEVFTNLLSNAIKYGPEKGKIIVDIEDDKDNWRIMVKDNGIGVPDQYKEDIFHRFERVSKGGIKGTGLGLAIVQRIVKLHNGKIWVEDNTPNGSVFYVNLPKTF